MGGVEASLRSFGCGPRGLTKCKNPKKSFQCMMFTAESCAELVAMALCSRVFIGSKGSWASWKSEYSLTDQQWYLIEQVVYLDQPAVQVH